MTNCQGTGCGRPQRSGTRRFRCCRCDALVGLCCWRGALCADCDTAKQAADDADRRADRSRGHRCAACGRLSTRHHAWTCTGNG